MANFQPLVNAMDSGVKAILNELIDGTIEDLDGPIREISRRLAMAASRNRPELVQACMDQLAVIVLEKRLRVEMQGSGLFETILNIGVTALINGAIGGLGSARV